MNTFVPEGANYYAGAMALDSNSAQVYKTAWAAIQHVRTYHTTE